MLHILLVIHNHQPLGNLPDVFRKAYEIAYKPFLDVVRKHPGIKWALHSSACLWEWLEKEEPEYLDILRQEHADGRLEFITGGMWEPIQPLISRRAFYHQFRLMRQFLNDRFGVNPKGSWTTERVWEPSLAGKLADAQVRYTFLDDSQLRAGLPPPDDHTVWGYYRTEYNGKSVAIFPINEQLRYLIPFRIADEVVHFMENLARTLPDNASITYGDDGEKFGMWPETYRWVYEKGWLDRFLGLVEDSGSITTTHPSKYLEIMPHPRQRVYIPTSSYREMGIWTLYPKRNLAAEEIYHWVESNPHLENIEPPHAQGFFRTFLARYPESRAMHDRVHEQIDLILDHDPEIEPSDNPDAEPLSRALWHALRAQCNCAYWHGVFGGLYLNYLRFGIHREILQAEEYIKKSDLKRSAVRRIGTVYYESSEKSVSDPESPVLIAGSKGQWVVCMSTGQAISAGSIPNKLDVIDVLARRPEAYHMTMVEASDPRARQNPESIHEMVNVAPSGWSDGHGYDKVRRGCFTDRVVTVPPSLSQLMQVKYDEEAGPSSGFWEIRKSGAKNLIISNDSFPWHREKQYRFEKDGRIAKMIYTLTRFGEKPFNGYVLLEFNLGLLAGNAPDRYHILPDGSHKQLADSFEIPNCPEIETVDEWTGERVRIRVPDADWMGAYPVKTLSRGEAGLEMTYQGTCLVFRIPVEIVNGVALETDAVMEI